LSVTIVLASGSQSRRAILQNAAVPFVLDKPELDETPLKKDSRRQGLGAAETALALARAKAAEVAARHPDAIVIGADQCWSARANGSINRRTLLPRRARSRGCRGGPITFGLR
jgi:septum formation protein